MASLTVVKGPDRGRRFELSGDRPNIGRDAQSDIRLHDGEISRHHAEIRRNRNGYILYDLQSSNGTFLNGERVQYGVVKTGDRISFGQTEMIFTGDATLSRADLASRITMTPSEGVGEGSAILSSIKQTHFSELLKNPEQSGSEWLRDSLQNLNTLYETSEAIRRITDIDALLERVLDLAFQAVKPDRAAIMMKDPETGVLEPKAIRYAEGVDHQERITLSRSITDWVMEKAEGVLVADATRDERFNTSESIAELGIREAICVPLSGRHDTMGVLYVDTKGSSYEVFKTQKPAKLKENHLRLMGAIAYQAGVAIEDTRFYEASVHAERLAAVGQTIAALSHHIKNILQGLRSGNYLVNMGIDGEQLNLVRQGWDVVQKNQDKIYNLVMDMLSFSKEREPVVEMTDINKVVREVVELMQNRAKDASVELTLSLDESLPQIAVDPEGVHRILLNIVTNAIEALDEVDRARHIEIATKVTPNSRYLQLLITDNGPGIPADEQKRIFNVFHSTKGSKGTGLGLAVSQKIAHEHGGAIRVESQVGKGTTFIVELPVRRSISSKSEDSDISETFSISRD